MLDLRRGAQPADVRPRELHADPAPGLVEHATAADVRPAPAAVQPERFRPAEAVHEPRALRDVPHPRLLLHRRRLLYGLPVRHLDPGPHRGDAPRAPTAQVVGGRRPPGVAGAARRRPGAQAAGASSNCCGSSSKAVSSAGEWRGRRGHARDVLRWQPLPELRVWWGPWVLLAARRRVRLPVDQRERRFRGRRSMSPRAASLAGTCVSGGTRMTVRLVGTP